MRELDKSDINMVSAGLTEQTIIAGLFTMYIACALGAMFTGIIVAFLLEDA